MSEKAAPMTREEELATLIKEQSKDDTHVVNTERLPGHRNHVMSLNMTTEDNETALEEWGAGVVYDFEEMIERGDYGMAGEPITPSQLNPTIRRGFVLTSIPHGTENGYVNYRCRCNLCRAAASERQEHYRHNRTSRPIPQHVHGTTGGYSNYGCRCDTCKAAKTAARRRERARMSPEQIEERKRRQREYLKRKREERLAA